MACLDACEGDPPLRIAALLHDVGKPRPARMSDKTNDYTFYNHERVGAEMAGPILERLRFSNEERDADHAAASETISSATPTNGPTLRCGVGFAGSRATASKISTR